MASRRRIRTLINPSAKQHARYIRWHFVVLGCFFSALGVGGLLYINLYEYFQNKDDCDPCRKVKLYAAKPPSAISIPDNPRVQSASPLPMVAQSQRSRPAQNPSVQRAHYTRDSSAAQTAKTDSGDALLNSLPQDLLEISTPGAVSAPLTEPSSTPLLEEPTANPTSPDAINKRPNIFKRFINWLAKIFKPAKPKALQIVRFSTNLATGAPNIVVKCFRGGPCAVKLSRDALGPGSLKFQVSAGYVRQESNSDVTWDLSTVRPNTYRVVRLGDGINPSVQFTSYVTIQCPDCELTRPTPSPTPQSTPTPAFTPTPVSTPTPQSTATPISTPTPIFSPSPAPTPSPEVTPNPVSSPTPVSNPSPRWTPTPAVISTPEPRPTPVPDTTVSTPTPTPTPIPQLNETDYVNKIWPRKLPRQWESKITVEFRREEFGKKPTPSNNNGNLSSPSPLPTVIPGGAGNPESEFYEASAWIEMPETGNLEVLSWEDIGSKRSKSLDGRNIVTWTIPFKWKSHVGFRTNFKLIFMVQLRDKRSGQVTVTPYDLGETTIFVDWIPGTRDTDSLIIGLCFPLSLGMFVVSKKDSGLQAPSRYVNAWLEDGELPLRVKTKYTIGVNIGLQRKGIIKGQAFTEPDWGTKTELELLIALNSIDADVEPEWRKGILPKDGEMDKVLFDVTPSKYGDINLTLSIYLARDLVLLEKFRLQLPGEKAAVATRSL